ncbi:hypothetical protein BGT96224_A20740 [Blumeria graminis f. sp. tritici 96224]|nr:hypothetical protein BGT96224_A20740 [Blumeria graminis f. sp. tritici 96224]
MRVNADIPMEMSRFLSGHGLLGGTRPTLHREVMVWFQGHLHIFRETQNSFHNGLYWIPLTTIGHEIRNGELITTFIYNNVPAIFEFTKIIGDLLLLENTLLSSHSTRYKNKPAGYYNKAVSQAHEQFLDDICWQKAGFLLKGCAWINNVPGYLEIEAYKKGLLCRNISMSQTGSIQKFECIFRPLVLSRCRFESKLWQTSTGLLKPLQIPAQSNTIEVAERLMEFHASGTLCGPTVKAY